MLISFVIPCYRSEKTIRKVVDEIIDTVISHGDEYEIVMISDNSPDNVYSVIKEMCAEDPHLKGAELARNFGQHSAIMAAYSMCSGEVVVCVDDDGQVPVNETYSLLSKMDEGYDVVYAKYEGNKYSLFRKLGSRTASWTMEQMLNKPKQLSVTSFFAAKKYVVDEILRYTNPYPFIMGLVLRSTNKIANVPVQHRKREVGRSGYTLKKLISLWTNGFTAFSVKPLRIATIIGCLCAFIGFVVGIIMVIRKLINPDIAAGYTSLIAVLLFIGGLIMLMLGLIGEYIGRIYISLNNSPQYVIRDTINVKETEKDEMTQ